MSLFRKNFNNLSALLARFINSHSNVIAAEESSLTCLEKKTGPKFDGIQFALHNNLLALTYVKERAITEKIQFYYNTMYAENNSLPTSYAKESMKLLVFHGIPLTSQLHDVVFNSNIDFHKLVDSYFKNGTSRGTAFIENMKTVEQTFFPFESVICKTGFVYPSVYKYIKKCADEPITFAQEDRHFGVISSGGYKSEQIEHSLKLLDIRVQRIEQPGQEQWICTQIVNKVYSNRKFYFTLKNDSNL